MPEPLTSTLNTWRDTYGYIYADMAAAAQYFYDAGDFAESEYWPGVASSLRNAAIYMERAAKHFKTGEPDLYTTMYSSMHWIDNNWPSNGNGYELTMQKIIDTMWESNPLEAFFFVNYIDGMRASIWNLEIQETHLRDIYTHFLSWD